MPRGIYPRSTKKKVGDDARSVVNTTNAKRGWTAEGRRKREAKRVARMLAQQRNTLTLSQFVPASPQYNDIAISPHALVEIIALAMDRGARRG